MLTFPHLHLINVMCLCVTVELMLKFINTLHCQHFNFDNLVQAKLFVVSIRGLLKFNPQQFTKVRFTFIKTTRDCIYQDDLYLILGYLDCSKCLAGVTDI